MLKVVLVDDEPSVLEGLRIIADWNKAGFEIVGQASDGLSAFTIIKDSMPDLVICDICMPGLTGLELIEKIKSDICPAPKFLLLSGYNDFAYAQKALELGTLGYLTKPLDAEELASELSRTSGIIEIERNAKQESLELIRYTANQLFNDIMDGKRSEKLSRKARFIFGIPDNGKVYIMQFIADAGEETDNTPKAGIYDLLLQITGIQNENYIFFNGNGSYIIVIHDGKHKFTCQTELSEQIAEKLNGVDPDNYGFQFFWTLISGASGGEVVESIYRCGKQLEQLQIYCMLHPENNVFCYEAFDKKKSLHEQPACMGEQLAYPLSSTGPMKDMPAVSSKTGAGSTIPDLPFDKVVNALKGTDAHAVSNAVDEFFLDLDISCVSRRLFSICLYRLADVIRKMTYAYGIEANRVIMNFTGSITIMNPNCKKLALDMCIFIFEKINISNVKPFTSMEHEIIDYMKANCRKALSLQSIAEKFSLPAVIISKIIKKKTGLKFNDYFNYLRIEYAKTLFASANMKIATVCKESGYADYNYFTEKFKEFTGVSPSEYKKQFL